MNTYLITSKDLDKDNFYIGSTDLRDYNGHIECSEDLGTVRFKQGVKASGYIYFKKCSGITAGEGITARRGITAGWGITAGSGIKCKLILDVKLRIFAGTCTWRLPTDDEMTITCGKLASGTIAYGTLVETGLPEDKPTPTCNDKEVVIDGITYILKLK